MKYMDMHCDTIYALYQERCSGRDYSLKENNGHLDLIRMKKGECFVQNFALFVNLEKEADPYGFAVKACRMFEEEMTRHESVIRQAKTIEQLLQNERDGRMSAVLTIEEGDICRGEPSLLREFYEKGVRMMTLTWNHENKLAWPNRIDPLTGALKPELEHGLKKKGVEFVELMEELGIVVDVSHLGDTGFWAVADMAKRPFAASHSNARAVASHPRNLTDEMIRAIAETGGVIGINYYGPFLSDSQCSRPGGGESLVSDMVRHIRHIKNVGGIDCIGLGSDFDGIEGRLEIGSPTDLHLLEEALSREGFTIAEIEKMFWKNVFRLYQAVWK